MQPDGKGEGEEVIDDKEMMASLLNEWSAGGAQSLSLDIIGDGENK